MSYCVNCGRALQPGAKYCSSCGTAVAPGAVENRPRRVPAIDYVRDGLAALALILSLFTVWSAGGDRAGQLTGNLAAENLAVLVVTLISIASLSIPYLWRAGIFGPAWSYKRTQDARLLANAPYFLLVLVYLIIEVVVHPGLGPAVAFGLAGAILAAQPRSTELADGDADRDRRWIVAALVIAGVIAVLTLVQIIQAAMVFDAASMIMIALLALGNAALLAVVALGVLRRSNPWRMIGVGMGVTAAIFGLLSLSPQFGLTKMTTTALFPSFSLAFWLAFGAAVSAPSVARLMSNNRVELVGAGTEDTPTGEGAEDSTPLVARPVGWLAALRPTIDVAIGVNALMAIVAIIAVIRLTSPGEHVLGAVSAVPFVLALVFGVVGAAGGVIVRRMARKDPRQGHVLATAYAALLFLLGLVLVILWSALGLGNIAPLTLLIAFAIPAALLLILWGTPAAREHFGSLPPSERRYNFAGLQQDAAERERERGEDHANSRSAAADHGAAEETTAAAWAQLSEPDETESEPAGAEASGATAVLPDLTQRLESPQRAGQGASASDPALEAIRAEAANRKTSAIRLREIASTVPEARAAVASNPKAYPDLLTWLGNLGDPDVDAALERRKR